MASSEHRSVGAGGANPTEQLTATARETVEWAAEKARQAGESGKAAGADQIEGVARAVRGVADQFEEQLPSAASYVRDAAEGIERASSTLRDSSIEDICRMTSDFARRQPVAFFGAAVLAGFALSRFLKSSAEGASADYSGSGEAYGAEGEEDSAAPSDPNQVGA